MSLIYICSMRNIKPFICVARCGRGHDGKYGHKVKINIHDIISIERKVLKFKRTEIRLKSGIIKTPISVDRVNDLINQARSRELSAIKKLDEERLLRISNYLSLKICDSQSE